MPKVSTAIINAILHGAQQLGVDVNHLAEELHLNRALLQDSSHRVDCEVAFQLMDHAWQLTGDELFGFHLGQQIQPTTIGIMGYLVTSAPTLRQGLESFCHYQLAFGEGVTLELSPAHPTENADAALCSKLSLRLSPDLKRDPGGHTIECNLAAYIAMTRNLLAKPVLTESVCFRHGCAGNLAEYIRFFGTENILFNQAQDQLILADHWLDMPLWQANKALFAWSQQQALKILGATKAQGFTAQVKHVLLQQFNGTPIQMDKVATQLHISSRSLQRLLQKENTRFSALLDEIRKEFACLHLNSGQMTVDEIGYLMGYSDASAFRKAFKKWTAMAPSVYRSNHE